MRVLLGYTGAIVEFEEEPKVGDIFSVTRSNLVTSGDRFDDDLFMGPSFRITSVTHRGKTTIIGFGTSS